MAAVVAVIGILGGVAAGAKAPDPVAARKKWKAGIGVNGGFMLPSEKDLKADTFLGGQVSYWPSELKAVSVTWGSCNLVDEANTGTLKVSPVLISAVLSLPANSKGGVESSFRWLLGFGAGFLVMDHTDVSIKPGSIPVLAFHGGGETVLGGGVGRVYFDVDITKADIVKINAVDRDLSLMTTLKVGIEILF